MSSNEYISINRLASSVAEKYNDSTAIVIYFDTYYKSDFNKINIVPLKVYYLNQQKAFNTVDFFPSMRYISAPNFLVKEIKNGLNKLLIEVKETKNKQGNYTYHKVHVYNVNNPRLHERLNPNIRDFDNDLVNIDVDPDNLN